MMAMMMPPVSSWLTTFMQTSAPPLSTVQVKAALQEDEVISVFTQESVVTLPALVCTGQTVVWTRLKSKQASPCRFSRLRRSLGAGVGAGPRVSRMERWRRRRSSRVWSSVHRESAYEASEAADEGEQPAWV